MTRSRMTLWIAAAALASVFVATSARAKNIDLSTVPDRETVQLTIYNSEDLTLVRESRKVSFKPGVNPLQFSWANTLIDPTSVKLRFLTDPDKLDVLDTTFPHDKPQMLYWNVQSEIDGEATVEITYFTSGISWSADYVCIADADETQMSFENFVRVYNNSGEEYEDAQVRLVVGQINLVEKIAQLARISMEEAGSLSGVRKTQTRLQEQTLALAINRADKSRLWAEGKEADEKLAEEKQIVKEGLSEYFIYTIEGTETIPNGWSKRMRSFEALEVPFKIEYRYREPEYGPQLVRMYLLKNDKDSKLGTTPLPDGVFRIFRDNGRDGLTFLVAQPMKYIPIGDKIELNLGPDPDVIFELVKDRVWRDNLWMLLGGTSVYRRVDDGRLKVEVNSSVAGWDEHTRFVQKIRNYTARPIAVEIRRSYSGHVEFRSGLKAKNHDYRTVEYRADVPAGETVALAYEVLRHEGHNKKQENVTIVPLD